MQQPKKRTVPKMGIVIPRRGTISCRRLIDGAKSIAHASVATRAVIHLVDDRRHRFATRAQNSDCGTKRVSDIGASSYYAIVKGTNG